jgi:hypothetical protein
MSLQTRTKQMFCPLSVSGFPPMGEAPRKSFAEFQTPFKSLSYPWANRSSFQITYVQYLDVTTKSMTTDFQPPEQRAQIQILHLCVLVLFPPLHIFLMALHCLTDKTHFGQVPLLLASSRETVRWQLAFASWTPNTPFNGACVEDSQR